MHPHKHVHYVENIHIYKKIHLHRAHMSVSVLLHFLACAEQWKSTGSSQVRRAENMLYKAAVCLLEDITSLNPAVSPTEPQDLRLSGSQTRGEGRTYRQQPDPTAEETAVQPWAPSPPAFIVAMHTRVMNTYLEIKDRTQRLTSLKPIIIPIPIVSAHVFFQQWWSIYKCSSNFSGISLPFVRSLFSLSWLSWPTVCGTHSSSHYLCGSVYLFILPLTGPYAGAICPPKSLRSPSLPIFPACVCLLNLLSTCFFRLPRWLDSIPLCKTPIKKSFTGSFGNGEAQVGERK